MKHILVGLAVLAACGAAQADENAGFYFGAGAGQVSVEIADFVPGILHFDESANVWKGFAGWRFNENFALEGAFIDADSVDQNFGGGVRGSVDGEILQVSGIGTYWFTDALEIHGRVSSNMYDSRSELTLGNTLIAEANADGTDVGFGGGFGAVWDRALFRLDYEQADLEDSETRLVTLSIAWRL